MTRTKRWRARRPPAGGAACVCFSSQRSRSFPDAPPPRRSLSNGDGWQVFTDGRAGGFVSYVYGDGYRTRYATQSDGTASRRHHQDGRRLQAVSEQAAIDLDGRDADLHAGHDQHDARSAAGSSGTSSASACADQLTPWTTLTAYIQFWSFIESEVGRRTYPNLVDVRQGYAKLEGPWGSFIAGRMRGRCSRAAPPTSTCFTPTGGASAFRDAIDSKGPTLGHARLRRPRRGFAAGHDLRDAVLARLPAQRRRLRPGPASGHGAGRARSTRVRRPS